MDGRGLAADRQWPASKAASKAGSKAGRQGELVYETHATILLLLMRLWT